MRLDEFMAKNEGKHLDFDGIYGSQCTDVCKFWEQKIGSPITHGNGKDYKINADERPNDYEWVKNTPTSVPQKGDIIVWGSEIGRYGHVAIFIRGDVNKFWSYDQNFPIGSPCHVQEHSYKAVIGYLRPKILNAPPPIDPKDKTISELEKKAQMLEEQITQLEIDKQNLIKGSQDKATEIERLKKKNIAITKLYDKCVSDKRACTTAPKALKDKNGSQIPVWVEKPRKGIVARLIEWYKRLLNGY